MSFAMDLFVEKECINNEEKVDVGAVIGLLLDEIRTSVESLKESNLEIEKIKLPFKKELFSGNKGDFDGK